MRPSPTFPRPASRRALVLVLALALPLGSPGAARAQGWIEPPTGVPGQVVARVETNVDVRVVDQVAHVEVTEWFENRGRGVAEGSYLYPLPGEAVFGSFSLWQGDLELRGEVLDAGEARAIYEAIVRRRADPALVELAGTGLLRARVFPIEPGEKRRVTLRYTQVLERSGDALQFRYAASSGGAGAVFAVPVEPRRGSWPWGRTPGPGGAEQVGGQAEPAPLRLELVAEDGRRFLAPFSPTHALRHEWRDGRLVVEAEGELRGRLSVFLPVTREGLGLALATHRIPGEDGYFMLTLTPGTAEEDFEPRDVTVVLDVSGSMSGEKMEQARSAVLHLLDTLSPRDRFRLVAFSNRVRPESAEWRRAESSALAEARSWVERLQADGGTDIQGALEEAFRLESPGGRLPLVVFLTDGLPTVGERSPERIAERVERLRGRSRVFAFGVGHDVDTHLLDGLSAAARGSTTYVEPGESVARALELLAAKVRHPVLTDVALGNAPVRLREVYPVTLPDLFAGEALVLFGRYDGQADGELVVTGRRGGRVETFRVAGSFAPARDEDDYIPRLWASRKLGHLSRQVRLEGPSPELVEEIRRTALRYGLPSEHTSYLVLEPGAVAQDGRAGPGVRPAESRLGMPVGGGPAAPPTTGAVAVRAAAAQARMRDVRSESDVAEMERALSGPGVGASEERLVAGRLFRLQDGVWTEAPRAGAGGEEGRTVTVAVYSDAWFELLRALPELVPVARSLDRVVLRGEAVALRLVEEGLETLSPEELRSLVRDFRGTTTSGAPDSPFERHR